MSLRLLVFFILLFLLSVYISCHSHQCRRHQFHFISLHYQFNFVFFYAPNLIILLSRRINYEPKLMHCLWNGCNDQRHIHLTIVDQQQLHSTNWMCILKNQPVVVVILLRWWREIRFRLCNECANIVYVYLRRCQSRPTQTNEQLNRQNSIINNNDMY